MWHSGIWFNGSVGWWVDLMIYWVFYNLNDSTILLFNVVLQLLCCLYKWNYVLSCSPPGFVHQSAHLGKGTAKRTRWGLDIAEGLIFQALRGESAEFTVTKLNKSKVEPILHYNSKREIGFEVLLFLFSLSKPHKSNYSRLYSPEI